MDDNYLDILNGPQREAVLDDSHTLLVLAGAGSGKTRVITTKIVHALKDLHYGPWQILAVTFTNKAAREMRSRVETMLGEDADLSRLEIKTFHSYGAGLLRRYCSRIGYPSSFKIYDDSDSISLLASLFPSVEKTVIREYARKISLLKDMGLDSDSTDSRMAAVCRQYENFRFYYRSYERKLAENQCVDFADLILRTNRLLEDNEDIRQALHRRYRLILVDEYQDSNGSQFELLRNIVGPQTQLVVVGDDDQSIYKFRGAEIRNILTFSQSYSNVRTIKLEENYRSSGSIISLAGKLISHNRDRHPKTIFTNNGEGMRPRLINCYSEDDEALKIANIISRDLGSLDTAILFRTNAQSRSFETILATYRIQYQLVGALRFYEREEVKDMLAVFSVLLNPRDNVSFSRIVNKPARGIGAASVEKIISEGGDCIASCRSLLASGAFKAKAREGMSQFLTAYDEAHALLDRGGGLDEFAILCANSFGLLALYRNDPDPFVSKSRVENINSLVTAMGSFQPSWSGLADFLESITLDSSTLPGDGESNRISADKSVVKLITMHNTKGLEFDRVFVTGLEDDIIPGNRETMNESDEEEERRILYVAVTRARSELYLTWVKRRKLWGRVMYQYPTRFFKDFEGCYEGTLAEGTSFSQPQTSYTNRYSYQPRSASPGAAGVSLFHEPPAKKTERAENRTVFCVDDAVLSPDYGRGVIVSAENRGDKTIIRVAFENGRKAIYNTKFCNLEKLDQGLDKPGGKTIE